MPAGPGVDAYRAIVLGYAVAGVPHGGGFALGGRGRGVPTDAPSTGERRRRLASSSRGTCCASRSSRSTLSPAGSSRRARWRTGSISSSAGAGGPRRALLRREPAGGGVVAVGGADRGVDRPDQHDGVHAPAVERPADPRSFMPTLPLAVGVLLPRFTLSQMDVPTRQSYVMAVVEPDERSAAAGVTGIARTTGAAISPLFSAVLVAAAADRGAAVLPRGGLKIAYDLLLLPRVAARRPRRSGRLAARAQRSAIRRPVGLDDPEPDPGQGDHDSTAGSRTRTA